jgi:hypothetical protein
LRIVVLSVHACSELGAIHRDAPITNSSIIGLESNVIAVKALYPSHKVVAIVGLGKCCLCVVHTECDVVELSQCNID